MNCIWAIMLVGGILCMLVTGNGDGVLSAVTEGSAGAVTLCISLAGIYCFWLGIMRIAASSGLTEKLSKAATPFLKKLFPGTGRKAFEKMTMNISANILGLSNAATPFGLEAMKELQNENPLVDSASDDMILFLILNTASLELIPTTVISLRESMGAAEPSAVIIPSLIATGLPCILGIVLCRMLGRSR